jgi:hypothetical protein
MKPWTGGLCRVGIEPVSNSILVEQAAATRDHDPWPALMEPALAGLNGHVIPSTSDEAPGLLAYVAQHLRAHHAPDLFPVQQELSKAVAAPLAGKQRAAAKAVAQAAETRTRVQEYLDNATRMPAKRGPGRPPKAAPCLEQVEQAVEAARHKHQRLAGQREQVTQSLRAIGHAYHIVDVERGVRRNGTRIAGDIRCHIDMIRTMAQHDHLSPTCLERLEKVKRVVPNMQATIEVVFDQESCFR